MTKEFSQLGLVDKVGFLIKDCLSFIKLNKKEYINFSIKPVLALIIAMAPMLMFELLFGFESLNLFLIVTGLTYIAMTAILFIYIYSIYKSLLDKTTPKLVCPKMTKNVKILALFPFSVYVITGLSSILMVLGEFGIMLSVIVSLLSLVVGIAVLILYIASPVFMAALIDEVPFNFSKYMELGAPVRGSLILSVFVVSLVISIAIFVTTILLGLVAYLATAALGATIGGLILNGLLSVIMSVGYAASIIAMCVLTTKAYTIAKSSVAEDQQEQIEKA